MLFSDYVKILQEYHKRTIGEKRLCDLLFDFVLDYATVEDNEKIPVDIGKDRISKMMNGKEPIHQFIRDHIYDQTVVDNLNESFNKKIVGKLVDNKDDLFFKMLQLIERDNISPSSKAGFRLLATEETIASFLAQVFIYAISTNSVDPVIEEHTNKETNQAVLEIKGIFSGKITDTVRLDSFSNVIGYSFDDFVDNIRKLAESISNIHIVYEKQSDFYSELFSFRGNPYTFDKQKAETIAKVCKTLEIHISDDFFDLGDLCYGIVPCVGPYGNIVNSLEGSKEAKDKLSLLEDLYDEINKGIEKIPFIQAFSDYSYLQLALVNAGTDYDEDVRVTVRFPKNTVIKASDVLGFEDNILRYYLEEAYSILCIKRGEDYLCFDESYNWYPNINHGLAFDSEPDITIDDIEQVMRYYFVTTDNYDSIEIQFDSINQYTAIAFPAMILIGDNSIKELEYSIRSKRSPVLIEGKVTVESN